MKTILQSRSLVSLFALTALFAGCVANDDSVSSGRFGQYEGFLHPDANPTEIPAHSAAAAAAAVKAPKDTRLRLFAKSFVPSTQRRIPNESAGAFKAQVRVAFNDPSLLTAQSAAFLQISEVTTFDRFSVVARYDGATDPGFVVYATVNNTVQGFPVSFTARSDVELQLEQTDTQLIFSARIPPDLGGLGVWTPLSSVSRLPSNDHFKVAIGMANVEKKGRFYFTDFRLAGAEIGGTIEGPILGYVKVSADAIRSAQAKLLLVPPDMAGATADLNTAIAASTDAMTSLRAAIDTATLQPTTFGERASKMLLAADKKLQKTQVIVATLNSKKAAGAGKGLKTVLGNQEGAMGNLLGAKVPNLASKPPLFTWHTD